MPVVPLDDSSQDAYVASITPFINSLFDKTDVRNPQHVVDAARSGSSVYSFADPKSRRIILESWLAAWKVACGEKEIDQSFIRPDDQQLINFLVQYISSWDLGLCTRHIGLSSLSSDPHALGIPFYEASGYNRQPFLVNKQWSYGTFDPNGDPNGDGVVAQFLWLLFHGAHVIVINNDGAQPPMQRFDDAFDTNANIKERSACPGNSHYGGSYAGADEYFLDIDDDVPPSKPFFLAFLVGDTASGSDSNGFMQLEGWQAQGEHGIHGGPRHEADLNTHLATIWNISTYGASAYSEKRCTPVFLARSTFKLSLDHNTHMPLYTGAASVQSWMEPGYISDGALDEILADVHDNVGHLYLFQRSLLIHWDPSKKQAHNGYPKSIESIFPGLSAQGFGDSIDAAYGVPKGHCGTDELTYFFFKGGEYVHYDPTTKAVRSKHSITGDSGGERWPGLATYFDRITAATFVPSSDGKEDKIFFFNGMAYVVFDVRSNKLEGPPYTWRFDTNAVELWPSKSGYFILAHADQATIVNYLNGQVDETHGVDPHLYGPYLFPGLWWD